MAFFAVRQLAERAVVGDQLLACRAGPRKGLHARARLVFDGPPVGDVGDRFPGRDGLLVQVERIADLVPGAPGLSGEPDQVPDEGVGGLLDGGRGPRSARSAPARPR